MGQDVKIAGRAAIGFPAVSITDIVSYPELREGTITLMDIAPGPLDLATAFARRLVEQNNSTPK